MAREPETRQAPPPPAPQHTPAHDASGVASVIGPDLKVVGNLSCKGAIQVNGEVEGDVVCDTLMVGEQGCIRGNISTKVARVSGMVSGQIEAAEVLIAKTAKMLGDVLHQSLTVEQGAYLEGHCARIKTGQDAMKPNPAAKIEPLPGDKSASGAPMKSAAGR